MWLFNKQSVSKLTEKRDIPGLINMLNDKEYSIVETARKALVELGDIDTIPMLFDFYKNKAKSGSSKFNAVYAIHGISAKFTFAQLSRLRYLNLLELVDVSEKEHTIVIGIMGSFGDPKYENFIIQSLPSETALVALHKCGSLTNLAPLLDRKSVV